MMYDWSVLVEQMFNERMTLFKQQVATADSSAISKELLDFCTDWLTNHIRVTDVGIKRVHNVQKVMINAVMPQKIIQGNLY